MSLSEILVNQIANGGLGGVAKPQGIDLNDDTFEKLLQKGMNDLAQKQEQVQNIGQLGAPAGFVIEPLDAPQETEKIKPINTEGVEIKDIDMTDFFTNVIRTQDADNQGIFDLAKKHATNVYNNFAGQYVTDLRDLLENTISPS